MNNQSNQLNVLFSADDNYAQHLGAAMYSLLVTNKDFEKINIYIVDNEISKENKEKLFVIVRDFSKAKLHLIDFSTWKKKLQLNMPWDISISRYARLYIADMLPIEIERVIYLDCDMIICDSLTALWNIDFKQNVIAAVQDAVSDEIKTSVGMHANQPYFNAGMLLIDLNIWRKQKVGDKCLKFIELKKGSVVHHDQGVLNGVLNNLWRKVDLKYNLMTIHFFFNLNQINKYYRNHSNFYLEKEIEQAKKEPTIIHYTPSFTTRPWVDKCKHPLKDKYWLSIANTPWKGTPPQKDKSNWYEKIINWRYRNNLLY